MEIGFYTTKRRLATLTWTSFTWQKKQPLIAYKWQYKWEHYSLEIRKKFLHYFESIQMVTVELHFSEELGSQFILY